MFNLEAQLTGAAKDSTLDRLDEQILWELSRSARVANASLAETLSVSPATIHNRLRRLREIGVWESNHAEIDMTRLGFHVHALISVRLKPQSRTDLSTHMKRFAAKANTMSVYVLGGPTDILVHIVCVSTMQLHDIVTREFNLDPDVNHADAQVVYSYTRGAQHMEQLRGFDDLRR